MVSTLNGWPNFDNIRPPSTPRVSDPGSCWAARWRPNALAIRRVAVDNRDARKGDRHGPAHIAFVAPASAGKSCQRGRLVTEIFLIERRSVDPEHDRESAILSCAEIVREIAQKEDKALNAGRAVRRAMNKLQGRST